MENRRRQATRRARCLLALAADYLKYLFMKRRRLLHKVARRTLALIHRHSERKNRLAASSWSSRALMEYEFSCSDSPRPAFLAVKRLLRSRMKGGGAAAAGAVSSCFVSLLRAPCGSPETTAAETEAAEDEDQVETEDDEEDRAAEDRWVQCCELLDVDDRAEEFINMFYEQLRAQSFAAVFQCSP